MRFALVLVVTAAVVGGVVPGRVAPAAAARPRVAQAVPAANATDRAAAAIDRLDRERSQLAAERGALSAGYERQLRTIDGLKRQRPSWRRDRQLRAEMSSSLDTARTLQRLTTRLRDLEARLIADRRRLVAIIDAELATPLPAPRRSRLIGLRTATRGRLGAPPRKIVVPDDALDPLADPEELDQQVAALRDSELELAREIDRLGRQAARFRRMSELRQQHARADDLALRDDEGPRRRPAADRNTAVDGAGGDDGAPPPSLPPTSDPGTGEESPLPPGRGDDLDGEPAPVLSDVVDAPTLDALRRAEQSADPAAKAAAADLARRRVADRLRLLRERRAAIERRARELRAPR